MDARAVSLKFEGCGLDESRNGTTWKLMFSWIRALAGHERSSSTRACHIKLQRK